MCKSISIELFVHTLHFENNVTKNNLKFADKKGNSLFAEVDDQRQQMRDLLSQQKQQYHTVSINLYDNVHEKYNIYLN